MGELLSLSLVLIFKECVEFFFNVLNLKEHLFPGVRSFICRLF